MQKVIVAMSGGVDSAVAAYVLQQQGFAVHGVFMKNYEPPPGSNQPCPWEQDQADVARTCEHLGIPWESWNFEKAYANRVLEYFFREYQAGRTPNPDTMCNREIKFGVFLTRARQEGFPLIATGHYARRVARGSHVELQIPRDQAKDQTYFLYQLHQAELAHVLFPLADLQKVEVRRIAAAAGIPVAAKPDSQGICFIGKVDVQTFLQSRIVALPGKVVTETGEVIGEHQGLPFYTIGQRHGLGVGGGVPYYVARKERATNTLIVAQGNRDPILYSQELVAVEPTWICDQLPGKHFSCSARIRYRQPLEGCTVDCGSDNVVRVHFSHPQRAITPGQAIVFYQNEVCLGGATIAEEQLQVHSA